MAATEPEQYRCPGCGSTQEIQRLSSQRKAAGHLKWLWCVQCRTETNHAKT